MTETPPIILGFDTSAAACRVAILRGSELLAHRDEEMGRGQAERLMFLCKDLLDQAGLAPRDLSAIGVCTGPGNFTGIRISVAAGRGLALGLGVRAIGVSAFDALRYGHDGACACAVEARRAGVYVQLFDAEGHADAPTVRSLASVEQLDLPVIGHGGKPPVLPTAVAVCHLARDRMRRKDADRPAPIYIRPADAAPPRDAPPRILS